MLVNEAQHHHHAFQRKTAVTNPETSVAHSNKKKVRSKHMIFLVQHNNHGGLKKDEDFCILDAQNPQITHIEKKIFWKTLTLSCNISPAVSTISQLPCHQTVSE